MKNSLYRLSIVFVSGVLLFGIAKQSISVTPEQEQPNHTKQKTAIGENQLTATARQKLQNAYDHYNSGDLDAAKNSLQEANQWLQKASQQSSNDKTKQEIEKLAKEVNTLSEQLTLESDQDKSAIVRFWHRSTALIKREMEDLIHSYSDLSTAEKTMKYLLDAKMHLFYAEHDLFVDHNAEYAGNELDNALYYMKEANQVAAPQVKKRISVIRKNIQEIKNITSQQKTAWHNESVNKALSKAQANLDEAKKFATPSVVVRLDALKAEINTLQIDIRKHNAKQYYDAAMAQLIQLINDL